ncbi:BIG/ATPase V1 complex, subunit S1 [Lipomyces arxii]|uniref:BIG/ATPase V1 complex, subunit S1 n=1 Tax=Lipomyces arxii TaxID=56418 RepID=UPI0034CEA53F
MLFSSTVKGAVLALAASLTAVSAFEDTSPLMLLSSKKVDAINEQLSSASITSADHFHELARKLVSGLKADTYVVVSQPGLHASDFVAAERATPNLRKLYDSAESAFAVRNAHGSFDVDSLEKHIVDTWGADTVVIDAAANAFSVPASEKPQVVRLEFPALPVDITRSSVLSDNDAFLYSVMSMLKSEDFAVIYTSTPISRPYVAKRNPVAVAAAEEDAEVVAASATTEFVYPTGVMGYPTGTILPTEIPEGARTDGSIFTRYQFFTPGMFMGIIASIVLLVILGFALKSISSIKISYEAFEKEMGPQTVQQKN